MNNDYFAIVDYNRHDYPCMELISDSFLSNRGNFLIDLTLTTNLIKESQISPLTIVDRNIKSVYFQKSIRTRGEIKIQFLDFSLEFGVIDYRSNTEIIGILGAPFLNQLFKTEYFLNFANDYERTLLRQDETIRQRITRHITRIFRNRHLRNLTR